MTKLSTLQRRLMKTPEVRKEYDALEDEFAELVANAKPSRSNVFADLALPYPDRELARAQLTLQIYRIVKKRRLTKTQVGKILKLKPPHVSMLMRNWSGKLSVGRLMEFLTAFGQDVRITVKPTRKAQGEMSVVMG